MWFGVSGITMASQVLQNTDVSCPALIVVFAVYIDSYLFVFATAILQHSLGVNTSLAICESAIILCLVFYVSTKVRLRQPHNN